MNHAFCTSILGEPCTVCQAIMSAAGVVSALCAAFADFGEHEEDIDIDIATVDEQGPFTQAPDEAGAHMVNPALSHCSWLLVEQQPLLRAMHVAKHVSKAYSILAPTQTA